ncbi:MAG: hypothetical protein M5U26_08365 [Planctomycetota bacterium]|nr:hypothetical protein [Planctomycetota bacterium]
MRADPFARALAGAAERLDQTAALEERRQAAASAPSLAQLVARADGYKHPDRRGDEEALPDLEAELARIRDGYAGFAYWLTTYCWIEDKETHKRLRFKPWPAQREIGRELCAKRWLLLLKARRLGFTTLLEAYAVWRVTFFRMYRVIAIFQEKEYAQEFLQRCKAIMENLPSWQRHVATKDNVRLLAFNAHQHGSSLKAVASSKKAARSLDADLVLFDEAAFHGYLGEALRAAIPAAEQGGGQLVLMSTSDGPHGAFFEQFDKRWKEQLAYPKRKRPRARRHGAAAPTRGTRRSAPGTRNSRWRAIFFPWHARPGRDEAWREALKADCEDPLLFKREYPATVEEAWEAAEGRVYPLFALDERFVRRFKLEPDWPRWRGIDWGGVDPFVCLWAAEIPGAGAGLTVDPACRELLRELIAYRFGENDQPLDEDNHGPDALRYLVVSAKRDGLRGHVHVYRELYVKNSAASGLSPADLAARVKLLSTGERFERSYADRSRPDSILLFSQCGVPTLPHRHLKGPRGGEIIQGIARVAALVKATADGSGLAALPSVVPAVKAPKGFTMEGNRKAALSFRGLPQGRPVFA